MKTNSCFEEDRNRLKVHLRELRLSAGLTEEQLGSLVGLKKQTISYLEQQTKPLSKMHYIVLRSAFENMVVSNADNLNLRDCYDLVFSDPQFYKQNRKSVQYAIMTAAEDTKTSSRKAKQSKKRASGAAGIASAVGAAGVLMSSKMGSAIPVITTGVTFAGSSTLIGMGGIAALMFPAIFSAVKLGEKKKTETKKKTNRVSTNIKVSEWLKEAFDYKETDSN